MLLPRRMLFFRELEQRRGNTTDRKYLGNWFKGTGSNVTRGVINRCNGVEKGVQQ